MKFIQKNLLKKTKLITTKLLCPQKNLIIVTSSVKQCGAQMSNYIYKNCNHRRRNHKWSLRLQPHSQLVANTTWSFGLHSHTVMTNHKLHIWPKFCSHICCVLALRVLHLCKLLSECWKHGSIKGTSNCSWKFL
jgi:hypothetical protein